MTDPLPPLNGVRSFVEAAKELSFSRAGERMGVTPGAVSRMVRKLEEHIGVRLMERTAHGLALTPQGAVYFRDVAAPLAAIGAATQRLGARRNPNSIVVACYPTFAARWLLPRWSRFFNLHPEIDVQLATSLNDVDFRRDEAIDLAIGLGTASDLSEEIPGLARARLLDLETVPVCAPGLFAGCGTEAQKARHLARQVLVHSKPLPGAWRNWLRAYRQSTTDPAVAIGLDGVDPARGPQFETLNLSFQAAAEGIGIAIGIVAFLRDDITKGVLHGPIAFQRRGTRHFHVVARTGGPKAKAVGLYREWLIEEARRID